MTPLAARDRRVLLAGLAAIGVLVLVARGLPAWMRWRGDVRDRAVEAVQRRLQTRELVEALPVALDTLEARTARLRQLGPAYLTGGSAADASAALTALVSEMAREALVRIDAMNVQVDTVAEAGIAIPRVRLDAQATGDVTGLADLMRRLEHGEGSALLAVRRLSVRPHDIAGPADQVETLAIRLTIEGLALVRRPEGERR